MPLEYLLLLTALAKCPPGAHGLEWEDRLFCHCECHGPVSLHLNVWLGPNGLGGRVGTLRRWYPHTSNLLHPEPRGKSPHCSPLHLVKMIGSSCVGAMSGEKIVWESYCLVILLQSLCLVTHTGLIHAGQNDYSVKIKEPTDPSAGLMTEGSQHLFISWRAKTKSFGPCKWICSHCVSLDPLARRFFPSMVRVHLSPLSHKSKETYLAGG